MAASSAETAISTSRPHPNPLNHGCFSAHKPSPSVRTEAPSPKTPPTPTETPSPTPSAAVELSIPEKPPASSSPTTSATGSLVSNLLTQIVATDIEDGDVTHIVITGFTGTIGGTWQTRSSSSGSWTTLASDTTLTATDYVRFSPVTGGLGTAGIQFKLKDSANALSTSSAAATITVSNNIYFSVTGPSSVNEGESAEFQIGYQGSIPAGESASVVVTRSLSSPTQNSDFSQTLAAAIATATASTPGISFNSSTGTLTFKNDLSSTSVPHLASQEGSGNSWEIPNPVIDQDSTTIASVQVDKDDESQALFLTGLGLNIPSGVTIKGVQVVIDTTGSTGSGSSGVSLAYGSSTATTTEVTGTWASSNHTLTVGSPNALWGHAGVSQWTPAQLNSPDFGFKIQVSSGSNNKEFHVVSAQVLVFYTPATLTRTLTISLPTQDDTAVEDDESFSIDLSSATRSDAGNISITDASQQTTILDNDENEAPTNITLSNNTVPENATPGQLVGLLSATDLNDEESFTYQLVSGTGATDNSLFAITEHTDELVVNDEATFLYHPKETLSIRVKVTDKFGATFEKALTINVANAAPVLNASGSPALDNIDEEEGNNSGTSIENLITSMSPGGSITDVAGSLQGIAITAADATHGNWQFSLDDGETWSDLIDSETPLANSSARLLAADTHTLIRFQPDEDFNGTITSALTFRAWDQSAGTNGSLASTSSNGGSSPFSANTDVASITVNPINDPPSFVLEEDPEPVREDSLLQTVHNFATQISRGGGTYEDSQELTFHVTFSSGDEDLFSSGPAIADDGTLTFTPAPGAYGTATFSVTLQDDGGDDDTSEPQTITITITILHAPKTPHVTNAAALEDQTTDADDEQLVITADPVDGTDVVAFVISNITGGTLYKHDGTTQIHNGDSLTPEEGNTGLVFAPTANLYTVNPTDIGFDVAAKFENGLESANPARATVTVTPVNDPPIGANKTLTITEDQRHDFTSAEFGFSDVTDNPNHNSLDAVKIISTSSRGSLWLQRETSDIQVEAGDLVDAQDIADGNFYFKPDANINGDPDPYFTFKVQDNGGTAHDGINIDQTARTFTFHVTPVNDPPEIDAPEDISVEGHASVGSIPTSGTPKALTAVAVQDRGKLVRNQDESWTFTPNKNLYLVYGDYTVALDYLASDGSNPSLEPATVYLKVQNSRPVLNDLSKVVLGYNDNNTQSYAFLPLDVFDADGDPLKVIPQTIASGASISFRDGDVLGQTVPIVYIPPSSGNSQSSFTQSYFVTDGFTRSNVTATQFIIHSLTSVRSGSTDVSLPIIVLQGEQNAIPQDTQGLSVEAGLNDAGINQRPLQPLGSVTTDLSNGSLLVSEPLDADLQPGNSPYSLVYDSSTAAPTPVIHATVHNPAGFSGVSNAHVSVKWYRYDLNDLETITTLNELKNSANQHFKQEFDLSSSDLGLTTGSSQFSVDIAFPNWDAPSGTYRWTLDISMTAPGTTARNTVSTIGDAFIPNTSNRSSTNPFEAIGPGWGISGIPYLISDTDRSSGSRKTKSTTVRRKPPPAAKRSTTMIMRHARNYGARSMP